MYIPYVFQTDKNVFSEEMEDIKCEDYLFKKDYYIQRRDIDINGHMHNLNYIELQGWVRTNRNNGSVGFIELNDGSFFKNIQIVFDKLNLYQQYLL